MAKNYFYDISGGWTSRWAVGWSKVKHKAKCNCCLNFLVFYTLKRSSIHHKNLMNKLNSKLIKGRFKKNRRSMNCNIGWSVCLYVGLLKLCIQQFLKKLCIKKMNFEYTVQST